VGLVGKVPHARQKQGDAGLVVPDLAGLAVGLDHQKPVLCRVKTIERGVVPAKLVAQNQNQVSGHVGALAVVVVFLAALQRSLQYNTLSQFLAQLLRQLMARPQTAQGFCGKSCLFPLKPEGLGMQFSNEKAAA
jgi:hypothetical protein